jgi:hypothetical protein
MGIIKHIAFCEDPIVFLNNRAIDKREAKKYPGLSMVPLLAVKLRLAGFSLETADIIMRKIIEGVYRPEDVGMISSGGSKLGEYMIKLGVRPLVVSAGESPLWMPDLYINIEKYVNRFKYKIFFRGAFRNKKKIVSD